MALYQDPKPRPGRWAMPLILVVSLAVAALAYWWQGGEFPFLPREAGRSGRGPVSEQADATPSTATPTEGPAIPEAPIEETAPVEFPMPALPPAESQPALPTLERSDPVIADALRKSHPGAGLQKFLNLQDYVQRVVLTIDNLPRKQVPNQMSMFQRVPGALGVHRDGERIVLDESNFARYRPFIAFAEKLDTAKLVGLYVRFYPMLDVEYRQSLGGDAEPGAGSRSPRFHDRVIRALDDMLAARNPEGPIELVQPKVQMRFADPELESRSAGQKMMMRMGPDNAERLKIVLRRFRNQLTGQSIGQ